MSFFLDNWILFSVALSSGALLLWPAVSSGSGVSGINPTQVVQLMNREKAAVIDVCETGEFASGHILGAKNLPLDQLEAQLAQTVKNKTAPLVMVCASGMRSRRAVAIAKKLGYEKAQSLVGGMGAWRSAGLPVEKS